MIVFVLCMWLISAIGVLLLMKHLGVQEELELTLEVMVGLLVSSPIALGVVVGLLARRFFPQ